jgi:SPASM domain peptide maturase of grasp-with-spasm system
MTKGKYLYLFESCRIITGYRRSMIYDSQRQKIYFIPNSMVFVLNKLSKKKIEEVIGDCTDNSDKAIVKSYIEFVLENELGIYLDETQKRNFPKIKLDFHYPANISNALVFFNKKNITEGYLKKIFSSLEKHGCAYFQFVFNETIEIAELKKITKISSEYNVKDLSLIFQHPNQIFNLIEISNLIITNPAINEVKYNNQESVKTIRLRTCTIKLIKKRKETKFFKPNIFLDFEHYIEANTFNTYLNQKIVIDDSENVLDANNPIINIGKIDDLDLLVKQKKVEKLWRVNKDKVSICNKCEFRYNCFDDRILKKHNENYVYDLECEYNPFIGKWKKETGFLSLKDSGIKVNESGVKINKKQLEKINEQLWGND